MTIRLRAFISIPLWLLFLEWPALAITNVARPKNDLEQEARAGNNTDTNPTNSNASPNNANSNSDSGNSISNSNAARLPTTINRKSNSDKNFPTDAYLRKQVRFWEIVFQKYPSTSVIVHDAEEPDRLVDLIDYELFAKRDGKTVGTRDDRAKTTQKYLDRYTIALDRFAKLGKDALRFGAIEKRVWSVYSRSPEALTRLYKGEVKLRTQTGLSDTFLEATLKAQTYRPYMESVFRSYVIPAKLTRLVFVESMFNLDAVSKVGASGIWQFMPATGRRFLSVERHVDERNNPWKATRAAALYLLDGYREMGSWPLAITGYNHGRGGLHKAIRETGTRDFGYIAKNYRGHKSFGFASRNYYGEFLAAVSTYDWLFRTGKIDLTPVSNREVTFILPRSLTVGDIMAASRLDEQTLMRLNPCLTAKAFSQYRNKPLPKNYEIRIPIEKSDQFKIAIKRKTNRDTVARR